MALDADSPVVHLEESAVVIVRGAGSAARPLDRGRVAACHRRVTAVRRVTGDTGAVLVAVAAVTEREDGVTRIRRRPDAFQVPGVTGGAPGRHLGKGHDPQTHVEVVGGAVSLRV